MGGADRKQPALIGGVIVGVLSIIPFLDNVFCCCLWALLGGIVAAKVLVDRSPRPVLPADGAMVGLLAGAVGGAIHLLIGPFLGVLERPLRPRPGERGARGRRPAGAGSDPADSRAVPGRGVGRLRAAARRPVPLLRRQGGRPRRPDHARRAARRGAASRAQGRAAAAARRAHRSSEGFLTGHEKSLARRAVSAYNARIKSGRRFYRRSRLRNRRDLPRGGKCQLKSSCEIRTGFLRAGKVSARRRAGYRAVPPCCGRGQAPAFPGVR